MVIQHNLAAMNAREANRKNVSGLKKKTEKLSTGYKINRASDNASGLSVSEKMRSQINGLDQASRNANDAISLIQTAEGGLSESEDIIQRMRELAVQASNGTYTDDDRKQIQYEIDALKSEVDRIAESTEFNTMKLLDGSNSGGDHFNTYGARYGIVVSKNAGSLAGAVLTSNIAGVKVEVTPNASGTGGENAYWSDDGKTLTLNLIKGGVYSQEHINDLIKNANTAKCASNAPAEITLSLPDGSLAYNGDLSDTGATVPGVRSVGTGNLLRLVTPGKGNGGQIDSADTITITANTYGTPADTGYAHSIEIRMDVGAGKETVDVNECVGYEGAKDLVLHLATGVTYTEKDLEGFLTKVGFDYSVDLSDQVDPDGDSDEHVRFLLKTTVPLQETAYTSRYMTRATESDPIPGETYYTIETSSLEIVTNVTEFAASTSYYYKDGNGNLQRVPSGTFADPSKEYYIARGGYSEYTVADVSDGFDPAKNYYKYIENKSISVPSVTPSSSYARTSDTAPVEGKKYYELTPPTYEKQNITSFAASTTYYTRDTDGTYRSVPSGTAFDSSQTYYKMTSYSRYVQSDVSSGFDTDKQYYEIKTANLPDYGVRIELLGGQGVGYGQYSKSGTGLVFQIGANGVEDQKLYVTIDDMKASALGISDVAVDSTDKAQEAIDKLDNALKTVSTQRAKLGAYQNRLEHSVASLNNSNENLTAAESRIRDTDIAVEMAGYMKDNILQQASQTMLAQANQQTNGILSLLG